MANWLDILAQDYTQGGRFNPFAMARGFTRGGREDIDRQRELLAAQQQAGIGGARVQSAAAGGALQARDDMRTMGALDKPTGVFVDSPESLEIAKQMLGQREGGQRLEVGALDIPYNTTRNRLQEMGLQDETSLRNYLREGGVTSPQQFNIERQAALDQSAMAGQAAHTAALQGGERRAGLEFDAKAPLLAESAKLSLEDQRAQTRGRDIQGFSSLATAGAMIDPTGMGGQSDRLMRAAGSFNPVAERYNAITPGPGANPAASIDAFMRGRGGGAATGRPPSPAGSAPNVAALVRQASPQPEPTARPLTLQPMQQRGPAEQAAQIRQQLRDLYAQYVQAVSQFEGPQNAGQKAVQGWSNLPEVRAMLQQLKQLEGQP